MKPKVLYISFPTTMMVCLLLLTSIKFSRSSNEVTKLLRNQNNEEEGSKSNQQIHDKSPIPVRLVHKAMDAEQKDQDFRNGRDLNIQFPEKRYPEYGRRLRWPEGDIHWKKSRPKHHTVKHNPKLFGMYMSNFSILFLLQ